MLERYRTQLANAIDPDMKGDRAFQTAFEEIEHLRHNIGVRDARIRVLEAENKRMRANTTIADLEHKLYAQQAHSRHLVLQRDTERGRANKAEKQLASLKARIRELVCE